MGGLRAVAAEVVGRLDDAAAEVVVPQPIGDRTPGEHVLRAREPIGERSADGCPRRRDRAGQTKPEGMAGTRGPRDGPARPAGRPRRGAARRSDEGRAAGCDRQGLPAEGVKLRVDRRQLGEGGVALAFQAGVDQCLGQAVPFFLEPARVWKSRSYRASGDWIGRDPGACGDYRSRRRDRHAPSGRPRSNRARLRRPCVPD